MLCGLICTCHIKWCKLQTYSFVREKLQQFSEYLSAIISKCSKKAGKWLCKGKCGVKARICRDRAGAPAQHGAAAILTPSTAPGEGGHDDMKFFRAGQCHQGEEPGLSQSTTRKISEHESMNYKKRTEDLGFIYLFIFNYKMMWTLRDSSFRLCKRLLSRRRNKTILHRVGQEGLNCSKGNSV